MSQHDYNIANGGGAAVRADINNALLAILSQNSGATAPTTTKPFMLWYDTTTAILKIRNAADNAWVTFAAGAIADASIAQAKLAANVAGNGPAFSAYASNNQTISHAALAKILLNNEVFDTNSNFDKDTNYRFQPTVAGYYQFSGSVAWNTSNAYNQAALFKNGSLYAVGANASTGVMAINNVAALIYLNGSTDYVELYAGQFSGSNQTTAASSINTFLTGFLARAA